MNDLAQLNYYTSIRTGHLRNTCVFGLLREEWHG